MISNHSECSSLSDKLGQLDFPLRGFGMTMMREEGRKKIARAVLSTELAHETVTYNHMNCETHLNHPVNTSIWAFRRSDAKILLLLLFALGGSLRS